MELFCVTPVTFAPMTIAMVSAPEPVPEFIRLPVWLMEAVLIVTPLAIELLLFMVRSPVPIAPLDSVSSEDPLPLLLVSVVPELSTVNTLVLMVRPEVPVVFSVMPVTLELTPPEIVTSPEPELAFVKVPELLSGLPEIVIVPVPLVWAVTFPVPVPALMPPEIVKIEPATPLNNVRSWLLRVMAPLKVELPAASDTVAVPEFPEATTMGFATKAPFKPPANVALLFPVESPMVIVLDAAPKAVVLVWPSTVPAFMVRPVVKELLPDNVSWEVGLFWTTPVTFVLMTWDIVVVPEPEPELVMVPTLLTVFEMVMLPVLLQLSVRLPLPLIALDRVSNPEPVEVKVFRFGVVVRLIVALIVSGDEPVWYTAVTLLPIAVEMVVVPEPEPEL